MFRLSADQAASPTAVFGIMLQDFPSVDYCQNFIQPNLLTDHRLLRMLCDPESSRCRLRFDASQYALEFGGLLFAHAGASVSHQLS